MRQKSERQPVMGWIGVETLPLTERKADLPLVLYEK